MLLLFSGTSVHCLFYGTIHFLSVFLCWFLELSCDHARFYHRSDSEIWYNNKQKTKFLRVFFSWLSLWQWKMKKAFLFCSHSRKTKCCVYSNLVLGRMILQSCSWTIIWNRYHYALAFIASLDDSNWTMKYHHRYVNRCMLNILL